jgi:hypothetical protein
MKRFSIALAAASIIVVLGGMCLRGQDTKPAVSQNAPRQPLDRYGGATQLRCANKTGHFILTKIANRWWFCTPAGNVFISMSVGNVLPNGNPTYDCNGVNTYPIYAAKYGDTSSNWGWQTLKRMTAWGFNSVGQDSNGNVLPWQTCSNCVWPSGKQPIPLPYLTESKPAEYASVNTFGYLAEPIKDEISGTNDNYTTWRGGALYDVFDPGLNTEWQKELGNSSQPSMQQILNNSPYLLGVFTDDSDYFWGSGAGPDFATGHTNANIAWVTLITSPVQTYIQSTPFQGKPFLYQTTRVYSKTLATNPSTPCSISNPCSLRDYLWQKYGGNITNLNKVWGANYTTFDSTGNQVKGEVIGTGDGVRKVFTYMLAHVPVSPYSALFFVGDVAKAGDCPWFHKGCGVGKNLGTIGSPAANQITQSSSTINYSTGAATITFLTPPTKGTAITVNYIYGGWMAGGTGLMDEDGSHTTWVGTNPLCLKGADTNYPTYFSCVGGGGVHDPVPNANATLGADLDNWVPQMAAKYFKTMHDDLKAVSKVPYLGLDTIGSWGAPAYSKFLEGAAPYLDGAFVAITSWAPSPSPAVFQSAYQYLTRYLGEVPLLNFTVITAEADSSMSCHVDNGPNNVSNQRVRGEMWYNTVSYLLSTPGYNGTYPFVGFDWWSWQDFQDSNQGLVSVHDNVYDGHEAASATVPCSAPLERYSCGGEATTYGNAISNIKQASALWYRLLP